VTHECCFIEVRGEGDDTLARRPCRNPKNNLLVWAGLPTRQVS
jgi:hypothetical protein